MSKKYNMVKQHYKEGRWPIRWVADAAGKKVITAAEYQEITGEVYKENDS